MAATTSSSEVSEEEVEKQRKKRKQPPKVNKKGTKRCYMHLSSVQGGEDVRDFTRTRWETYKILTLRSGFLCRMRISTLPKLTNIASTLILTMFLRMLGFILRASSDLVVKGAWVRPRRNVNVMQAWMQVSQTLQPAASMCPHPRNQRDTTKETSFEVRFTSTFRWPCSPNFVHYLPKRVRQVHHSGWEKDKGSTHSSRDIDCW